MPVPPELATPPEYIRKRPRSPGIPPALKDEIAKLEPVARRYRARMPESSAAAKSNRRLTELVVDLYNQDVTITELAAAAGVTYRAMARRLGRI
jgi:hypothetical protein